MADAAPHRWFAVGSSADDDSFAAAKSATGAALEGDDPRLLVAFFAARYAPDEIVAGIRAAAGEIPLIGCSTAGEIAAGGTGRAGVVVSAFGGQGFTVRTASAEVDDDLRAAGRAAASSATGLDGGPHRVLLVLTDGLAGDQQEIVRGLYDEVGAVVPLVGGCAGDDLAMQQTVQLHGDGVLHRSVVTAAIASDAPFGIGVEHGWRRVGEPMAVTHSTGTTVHRLDDHPALDAYLDRLDAPSETYRDHTAFTRYATTHPLGLARRDKESIRFVNGADFGARTLECIASVPQGGLVWLMEGNRTSVMAATDGACNQAFTALGGNRPLGLLAFDCIARADVLGESGIPLEIDRIAATAEGAPVAGFYTYGEIARTRGVRGFHNQTLVVLAVS